MSFNRNHFFLIGVVLLALGVQLRVFDSFVLNADASAFVNKQIQRTQAQESSNPLPALFTAATTPSRRTVKPPQWIGWALLSAGAVLVLHALALRKVE